jgi:hypothetical protein
LTRRNALVGGLERAGDAGTTFDGTHRLDGLTAARDSIVSHYGLDGQPPSL